MPVYIHVVRSGRRDKAPSQSSIRCYSEGTDFRHLRRRLSLNNGPNRPQKEIRDELVVVVKPNKRCGRYLAIMPQHDNSIRGKFRGSFLSLTRGSLDGASWRREGEYIPPTTTHRNAKSPKVTSVLSAFFLLWKFFCDLCTNNLAAVRDRNPAK